MKDTNSKLQTSLSGCEGDHQGCQEDLEGCVLTIDEQVKAETQILQEQIDECNSNFEARVRRDVEQMEEELNECQGVKNELLENVSWLEGVDMAC